MWRYRREREREREREIREKWMKKMKIVKASATAIVTFDPAHQLCSSSVFCRAQIDFFRLNKLFVLSKKPFIFSRWFFLWYQLKNFFTIARLNINNLSLNIECSVNGMFKVKSYFAIWSGWTFVSFEIAIYRFSADVANSCKSFARLSTFCPME